jgi:NAD(P)-dependent dehydrogenase (short-subunit alcohol dehydrogenase family)
VKRAALITGAAGGIGSPTAMPACASSKTPLLGLTRALAMDLAAAGWDAWCIA